MAPVSPAIHGEIHENPTGTWPHDLSHEPSLKIGEFRERLLREFPKLELSKIRYYESIGLINSHRTASNHRLFSAADVERLRFVLQQQRDLYLPLDQIGELLRQLDAGEDIENVASGRMRLVSDNDIQRPQVGTRLSPAEVSDLTGVSLSDIEELVKIGVLKADSRGRFTSQAPEIVRFAYMLQQAGFDARHVRSIAVSAHSHAVNVVQSVATDRAKRTSVAQERALTKTGEAATIISRLYRALLTENIEVELR